MERVMNARVTRVENIIKAIQRDVAKIFIKLLDKGESIVAEEEAKYIEDYLHQVKHKIETWQFNLDHHDQVQGLTLIKSAIEISDANLHSEERYSLRGGRRSKSVVEKSTKNVDESTSQNYQHDEIEIEMDSYEPFTVPADDSDTDYENDRPIKVKLAKLKSGNSNFDGKIKSNQHIKGQISAKNTRINKFKRSTFERNPSESYEIESGHQEIEIEDSFQSDQDKNLDKNYKKVGDFFKCLLCNIKRLKYHSTYADYEKHYAKVHTYTRLQNPLKCKLDGCSQLLYSRQEMEIHKNADHSSCSICSAKFETRKELISHIKEAHKSHMFRCKLCCSAFTRLIDLKHHLKIMHEKKNDPNSSELKWQDCTTLPEFDGENQEIGQDNPHSNYDGNSFVKCDYDNCGEIISMQNAEFHRCTHEIPDFDFYWAQLTCPVCRKIFTRRESLKRHLLTQHLQHLPRKSKFLYKCSICDKAYAKHYRMRNHEKSHTTTYPCPKPNCKMIFNLESTLKMHLKRRHGHLKCSFEKCDFHFTTQVSYDTHVKNYHVEKVVCPICSKLLFKARLRDHNQSCHRKRAFKCTFEGCSQVFNKKESAKVHYKDEHDPSLEPEFLCTICGVGKWTKSSLGDHFRSNHVLLLKCPTKGCRRTFSTRFKLSEHNKTCMHKKNTSRGKRKYVK